MSVCGQAPTRLLPGKGCVGTDFASGRQAPEGLGRLFPEFPKTDPHLHWILSLRRPIHPVHGLRAREVANTSPTACAVGWVCGSLLCPRTLGRQLGVLPSATPSPLLDLLCTRRAWGLRILPRGNSYTEDSSKSRWQGGSAPGQR